MLSAPVSQMDLNRAGALEERCCTGGPSQLCRCLLVPDSGVASPETLVLCAVPESEASGRRGSRCLAPGCVWRCGYGCVARLRKFQTGSQPRALTVRGCYWGWQNFRGWQLPMWFLRWLPEAMLAPSLPPENSAAAAFSSLCWYRSHFHSIPL